ncbi:MAG: 30S ribosomal protein S17 [Candidatus Paceibacterota bacterium]|jgi:small subunit ribosomal protein S17
MEQTPTNKTRRILTGKVVSEKMKDTVVVLVETFQKAPKYGKYLTKGKKFKAHNPGNTKHLGETVKIEECKPISKDKHFKVI